MKKHKIISWLGGNRQDIMFLVIFAVLIMLIISTLYGERRYYPNVEFLGGDVKDVNYREVVDFLRKDNISDRKYVSGVYMCGEFADDVRYRAYEAGIRCAYVVLPDKDGNPDPYNKSVDHAIVAFNTLDQGMCYFEAQTDSRTYPKVVLHTLWNC